MDKEKDDIKKQALEETKDYFTEEGGGVFDCRLCGESGFMELEELTSHFYEEHPREFCDCAIDFAMEKTKKKFYFKEQDVIEDTKRIFMKLNIEDFKKVIDNIDDEEFAELFHKEYEKASLAYGWKTQEKCQTDFWNLPEANRKAMIGTVIQIKLWLWKLIDDVFKFKTEVENNAKT